jgi:hypothetical protein
MAHQAFKSLGIDFAKASSATQEHELGLEVLASDGATYKYIRAGATIVANDALFIDYAEGIHDYHPTTGVAQPVDAVAEIAIANNEFGWVKVHGPATVKVENGVLAGEHVVSTAVSGELDTQATLTASVTNTEGNEIRAQASGKAPRVISITTESVQDLAQVWLR